MFDWLAGLLSPGLLESRQNERRLRVEVDCGNRKIRSLQQSLETAQSEKEQALERIATVQSQMQVLKRQLDAGKTTTDYLQATVSELNGDLATAEEQLAALRGLLSTAEDNVTSLERKNRELTEERDKARKDFATSWSKMLLACKKANESEDRVVAAEKELEGLRLDAEIGKKVEAGNLATIKALQKELRLLKRQDNNAPKQKSPPPVVSRPPVVQPPQLRVGNLVIHPEEGTGRIRQIFDDSHILVRFRRPLGSEDIYVPRKELRLAK